MSHNLISNPEFSQVVADFTTKGKQQRLHDRNYDFEYQKTADMFLNLAAIGSFTVIFELFNADDNPVNFNHQRYEILVSDTSGRDIQLSNYYDIYNRILHSPNDGWLKIRDIDLGITEQCNNSFTDSNQINGANILHFKYCRLKVPEIPEHKIRITVGLR